MENPETLEDVKLWLAAHDARINELWKQQHAFNIRVEARLTALEKRIIWLTTLAAAGGGVGGNLIVQLFGI